MSDSVGLGWGPGILTPKFPGEADADKVSSRTIVTNCWEAPQVRGRERGSQQSQFKNIRSQVQSSCVYRRSLGAPIRQRQIRAKNFPTSKMGLSLQVSSVADISTWPRAACNPTTSYHMSPDALLTRNIYVFLNAYYGQFQALASSVIFTNAARSPAVCSRLVRDSSWTHVQMLLTTAAGVLLLEVWPTRRLELALPLLQRSHSRSPLRRCNIKLL